MIYKRAKIYILLFILCAISFFTNDFQLINIEKTAIIVALGIDKNQDEYEVTTQIAIPQASTQNSTNSDAILSAKGKTVYDALENISLETGWYPKLTFCNLIIINQELFLSDYFPLINYFLTSSRVQNSAVIASCEKSAKEVLSSSTPLDYVSSFALQKILLRNLDRTSSVLVNNVEQFASLNYSHSAFGYIPLIKSIQTDDKPKQDGESTSGVSFIFNDTAKSSNSNEQGSQKGGANQEKTTLFYASDTIFFSNGKKVCTFNKEQTQAYSLLTKPVREAFIAVNYTKNGKDVNSLLSIVDNVFSFKLEINNGIPILKIKLKLVCEREEFLGEQSAEGLSEYALASGEGLNALKQKMQADIKELFELSKQTNCDFFQIKELLYRKGKKDYFALKDSILQVCNLQFCVECKNYR